MNLDGMKGVVGETATLLGLAAIGVGCGPTGGFVLEAGDDETGSNPDGDGDGDGATDPSTGGPNDIPLELLSARTDKTGKFLLLRFSEAMASPAQVDPRDFRVSYAYSSDPYYDGAKGYSFYFDPNGYLFNDVFSYLEAISIDPGQKPTDLLLKFEVPLNPDTCLLLAETQALFDELNPEPDFEDRVGLFPHYAPGGEPVRSADGETLAAIGPAWVEYAGDGMYTDGFGFPDLEPQIPINCIVEP